VHADVEVEVLLEDHLDVPAQLVALLGRVLPDDLGELLGEGLGVDREPVVVVAGQLHDEVIGNDRAALADDRRAVVQLTLQRAGDLHGLNVGFERLREGSAHQSFETALEALENSHVHLLAETCPARWRTAGVAVSRPPGPRLDG
jgi:hypothetical protein